MAKNNHSSGKPLSVDVLDSKFKDGAQPTGNDFANLIASTLNLVDDGIESIDKGKIKLSNEEHSIVICPEKIKSTNQLILKTLKGNLKLHPEEGEVQLKNLSMENSEATIEQIQGQIITGQDKVNKKALPTTKAVVDYINQFSDNTKEAVLTLFQTLYATYTNLVIQASNQQIQVLRSLLEKENIYNSISDCLKCGTPGSIYVMSTTGIWREYINIVRTNESFSCMNTFDWESLELIFSPQTTLCPPLDDGKVGQSNLINIIGPSIEEGQKPEQLNVKITANINGEKELLKKKTRAIYCQSATLDFTGNIKNASSVESGGAIKVSKQGKIKFRGEINGCQSDQSGGAIAIEQGSHMYMKGDILNCQAGCPQQCQESLPLRNGGAVSNAGTFILQGNILSCKTMQSGGAVENKEDAYLEVQGNLYGCQAKENGGAVYGGGKIRVSGIRSCQAMQSGGAMYLYQASEVFMSDWIEDCTAKQIAGALYLAPMEEQAIKVQVFNIRNCGIVQDLDKIIEQWVYASGANTLLILTSFVIDLYGGVGRLNNLLQLSAGANLYYSNYSAYNIGTPTSSL
ncbi:hypothetical protein [Aureibacter tunicatorum]|uniref:Uncharacterized protein n=1 Tax=Aureibacter tunicatorum TaxID=866807 RepID=A0AAE3XNY2_9BACT|nr:hypothetical protein [Aureibacter tunicatorum]MDR6240048.1 hypothetical protein [Aureibacter tunicatorum]BDD04520.1 hypothetical protein AUTU_20030 [Aureibacter tunicatorum]